MEFLAYTRLKIFISIPPEVAKSRLYSITEPPKFFRKPFSKEHCTFQGVFNNNIFKITRIINYRNSFAPVIKGKINENNVEITMRLHIGVIAFVTVWISGSIISGLSALASKNSQGVIEASIMGIFMYLLTVGCFMDEASKVRNILEEVFKA